MFLVCGKILDIEDPGVMMERLGLYMLTVILGLFIHAFITLSLVYFAATRKNPFIILRGVLQALVTAFGTGSRYHYSCLLFTGLKANHPLNAFLRNFAIEWILIFQINCISTCTQFKHTFCAKRHIYLSYIFKFCMGIIFLRIISLIRFRGIHRGPMFMAFVCNPCLWFYLPTNAFVWYLFKLL